MSHADLLLSHSRSNDGNIPLVAQREGVLDCDDHGLNQTSDHAGRPIGKDVASSLVHVVQGGAHGNNVKDFDEKGNMYLSL
jgi:hypothetical protein